ncbi:SixA phosphatase family protein [Agromyces lapidis]|uniref:Histidine phosphatase family protein n=1 Tax=Agromyces lapidis TaxID=279574 RepID=A0ABV5SNY2_9MICO|nr:histidine phosphatase family protein [Agromyces lapidis]
MKTLYLVRHAKSDWGDPLLDDHDRPLNDRGLRDAPAMGRRLAERGVRPDRIVTSTAVRARSTARLLARTLGIGDDHVVEERKLYAASDRSILAVAAGLDDALDVAMLVGHNPGMSDAVGELTGEWVELPTCAVVECRVGVDAWAELVEGTGELVGVDTPKG